MSLHKGSNVSDGSEVSNVPNAEKVGMVLRVAMNWKNEQLLESYVGLPEISEAEALRLGEEHIRLFGGRLKEVLVVDGVVIA